MSLFKRHTDTATEAVKYMLESTEIMVKQETEIFEAVSMMIAERILLMETEGKLTEEERHSVFQRKNILPIVLGEAYKNDIRNWPAEKIDEAIHNFLKMKYDPEAGAWAGGEAEEEWNEKDETLILNKEKFKEFVKWHIKIFETGSKVIIFHILSLYVRGKIREGVVDILFTKHLIPIILEPAYIYGIANIPGDMVDEYILKSLNELLK